jgi:molybdate transport system substrate-binding protein
MARGPHRRRALTAALSASLLAPLVAGCGRHPTEAPTLRVAAAADLTFAFTEVGEVFGKKTGTRPTFTFGSTGLLAKQIEQDAPFDVFAAANVSFVDQVVAAGACDGATRLMYSRGRIVVWSRKAAGVSPPTSVTDLADPRFRRIAIANPEHAPYGRAAQESIQHAGVWEAVRPKLVFGENVQQTLQFAQTGNADVAVVALSLAIVSKEGVYVAIDEALHAPLDQAMVVCRHGRGAGLGKQFTDFVSSPDGRAILKRYGFLLPGEAVARIP